VSLKRLQFIYVLAVLGWLGASSYAFAADPALKILHGHVPEVVSRLSALRALADTNRLNLAIGLPLRDAPGLDDYLARVYNPSSADYRKYLTPEQFTEKFGPTEQSYQAVIDFAKRNNLIVTASHGNRLLLDVSGSVADVQRTFRVTLHSYRHPNEARDFYAPDIEPSVDASLPIADVSGLNNYVLPQPKNLKMNAAVTPQSGSGSGGSYLGNDFRAAYLPGVTLTGSGQMVGLLEFDGYYAADISGYETTAGLPAVPLQSVLLDGYNGRPTTGADSGNGEVSLDIEMTAAMAPGLSKIVVFEAGPNGFPNDILNAMASSNQIRQFSCSWGWGGGPSTTTDNIFKEMSAQGQAFFNASGDSDAFTTGASSANGVDNRSLANAPSSNPYITMVGGTTLTTGSDGSWSSETVWNWGLSHGSFAGSSGGISSSYSLPNWQANVDMTANGGSTTFRNIPDVSMISDDVYVQYGNGITGIFGGTSCGAPLWAGLTALANQQADATGKSPVGFINPTIYAIGASQNYAQDFHDTTIGNNTWSSSPSQFFAVSGYDLCTGWGTPAGQSLIDDLVSFGSSTSNSQTNSLGVVSVTPASATGNVGGPFSSPACVITLINPSATSLKWTLTNPKAVSWLSISPTSGTLAPQATSGVTLNFTTSANTLTVGNYPVSLKFSSASSTTIQTVAFQLQVMPVLSVQPTTGFTASGTVGGPFVPATQNFIITNLGGISTSWKASSSSSWLTVSRSSGTLTSHGQASLTTSLNTKANKLKAGIYKATVTVRDKKNKIVQSLPFTLNIGQQPAAAPKIQAIASTAASFDLIFTVTPGSSYQVQYKTNYTQPDWLNLGNPVLAETNSIKFSDTNIVNNPQKYYRLMLVPGN
jgi:Pro-kumamolisin, activation domain/Viral BACON domain